MAFLDFLKSLRPVKKTEHVLAAFQKVVDDLRGVHEAHISIADKHEEAAADALQLAQAARNEASRAWKALEHFLRIPGVGE